MDSSVPNETPRPGLPPVQPPSGRFIAQLFVVPGLLILAVVLIVLGLSYLRKREHEPAYFLQQLDSDNADIRWRGMSDLAQILKRSELAALPWKTDAKFALDLTERLDRSWKELLIEEKNIGELVANSNSEAEKRAHWRKLNTTQRDYVSYLAAALGDFHMPVGAPLLCAMLKHDKAPDLKGMTLQRRKALWSLMNMGENTRGFAKVPTEMRQQALDTLKEEARSSTPRGGWARTALYYLDKSAVADAKDIVKVDEALVYCASAEDQFLRKLVAMSFNFWDSDQAEATLLRLSKDNGFGTLLRVEEND